MPRRRRVAALAACAGAATAQQGGPAQVATLSPAWTAPPTATPHPTGVLPASLWPYTNETLCTAAKFHQVEWCYQHNDGGARAARRVWPGPRASRGLLPSNPLHRARAREAAAARDAAAASRPRPSDDAAAGICVTSAAECTALGGRSRGPRGKPLSFLLLRRRPTLQKIIENGRRLAKPLRFVDGLSTSRRRRDSSTDDLRRGRGVAETRPRTIYVAAAASPRPVHGGSTSRGRGVAATRRQTIRAAAAASPRPASRGSPRRRRRYRGNDGCGAPHGSGCSCCSDVGHEWPTSAPTLAPTRAPLAPPPPRPTRDPSPKRRKKAATILGVSTFTFYLWFFLALVCTNCCTIFFLCFRWKSSGPSEKELLRDHRLHATGEPLVLAACALDGATTVTEEWNSAEAMDEGLGDVG